MNHARPRIGLVAASLDILGGQAVQARLLYERLQADGWQVDFIPVNPRFPARLGWLRRVRGARTMLNQALYLPSLAALRRCDVVHVFSASYFSFVLAAAPALLAAKGFGKRAILNYHSGEAADHLARWGLFVHPWLGLADSIVVPSEYLARVFAQHGYRARVVHNVVELDRFRFVARTQLRPALLSNRNLESHYRVDNNLRAYGLVRGRRADAAITVAGAGREEPRLRELVRKLGLEGVSFTGSVRPETMPELYARADLFVNSSVIDNQPLSVLEAFAAGTPVVTTGTGGIASMVRHGETGLIVEPDRPEAMASAIEELLARPDRALEMTRRAHRELEAYAWPHVREGWAEAYRGAA